MTNEIKTTMENTQATTEVWATEMDDFVFNGKHIIGVKNPDVTHIRFPEGITDIGIPSADISTTKNYFNNLKYIYISKSIKNIWRYTFYNKKSLQTIVFDKDCQINYIGEAAFENTGIINLFLPESIKYICSGAFCNCNNLISVNIKSKINALEDSIFEDCNNLITVKLSETVKDIGHFSFSGCSSLKEVDINSCINLKYISSMAFSNCSSLETFKLPPSKRIVLANAVFEDCIGLKNIIVSSITKLETDTDTFEGCYALTTTEDEGISKKDAADAYLMRRGIIL